MTLSEKIIDNTIINTQEPRYVIVGKIVDMFGRVGDWTPVSFWEVEKLSDAITTCDLIAGAYAELEIRSCFPGYVLSTTPTYSKPNAELAAMRAEREALIIAAAQEANNG